ncbi:MAG: hypothetical protein JSW62_01115 [Thermoplasmatales archaeon]|nr:MAG: hypothetical protein JSW62_01115 [Thermoplasmatales archaeon]
MKASCDLIIEYDDVKKVKNILKSIEVDDFDFVKSKVNMKKIEAHIESSSVSSLIHTLDDYLACISVAEKIVDKN